jgi:predicted SAM-dependent methyltransferase/glycosyltransferase involved in cell wall biosynthesis
MKIVELGGGSNPRFRPNVDCRMIEGKVDIVADFEQPLPLPSEEFDGVFSQYVIEHISWRNVPQFINEIFRILKPNGKATIITADLKAQAEALVKKETWGFEDVSMVFGGQDFPENTHKSSMSPEMMVRLFRNAGFNKVNITHLPNCGTDMIIEGEKVERRELFGRKYFDGEGYIGLYRDFPQHYKTAELILDRKPESVLELGGARGYICKILQSHGVPATCLDISPHCWHTRVIKEFILWDATEMPWKSLVIAARNPSVKEGVVERRRITPITERTFDICFSIAFLEHIPENSVYDALSDKIKEYISLKLFYHKNMGCVRSPCPLLKLLTVTERNNITRTTSEKFGVTQLDSPSITKDIEEIGGTGTEKTGKKLSTLLNGLGIKEEDFWQNIQKSWSESEKLSQNMVRNIISNSKPTQKDLQDGKNNNVEETSYAKMKLPTELEREIKNGETSLSSSKEVFARNADVLIQEHLKSITPTEDDWAKTEGKLNGLEIIGKNCNSCVQIVTELFTPKLIQMIKEMSRVTKRGLHGITFTVAPNDHDKTHVTVRPKTWWEELFKRVAPDYPVEIMDKEDMEKPPIDLQKMAPSDGLVKLNIGCFADMFYYGWKNIDELKLEEFARERGYIFERVNAKRGLPYPDGSADTILASHFLEHLNREEGNKFLADCFRVLKPDGLIRLAVPDTRLLSKEYLEGGIMEFRHVNVGVDNAPDSAEAFFHLLLAGHQTIYDEESIAKALERAGFKDIRTCEPFESASKAIELQTISMYPTLSLYTEAKRKQGIKVKDKETLDKSTSTHVADKLKIALLSTPLLSVPPKDYGGLELIVANLGMELAKLGHDVTIFAPKGSRVEGCRIVEVGVPTSTVFIDWLKSEADMFELIKDTLTDFDIINGHNWFGMEYRAKALNPMLHVCHTHHGGLLADWWTKTRAPFKLNMIAISNWMKSVYEQQGVPARTIYNGTDISKYPLRRKKSDRFLFLSRIAFFKAPHLAIEVAKKTGIKLDVVGATQFVEDAKYVEEIKKSCDGEQIRFIGEVTNEQKVEYLSRAKALLVTGRWGEPFGLHVVEAMATGTQVIAIADGGIAETVKKGGVLCADIDALTDAVKHFKPIPPTICRRNAMMFDTRKMALSYVGAYKDILAGKEW